MTAPPPPGSTGPGRKWYLVAALVFLLGMAAMALFLFTQLRGLTSSLQQVVVPGEAEVVLEKPGSYTIFHEHQSVVDGRYYSSPADISGLEVRVVSADTNEDIPLRAPGSSSTYSLGGRAGTSIFGFEVDDPGRYVIMARYADGRTEPRIVLAVGAGIGKKIVLTVLTAIGLGFTSFTLAIAIAAVTFWRRRKARRAVGPPQVRAA